MQPQDGSISAEELLAEAGFLQRLARGLVADEQAAADLVQETLVVGLERPPQRGGPIRGWLATVATNLARNARRSMRRRGERERAVARDERVDAGEGEELSLERLELQRVLFEFVLALPAEQRAVLYLRYYEERTPGAIAQQLGVPETTIKSRQTRALAALRERFDARSGGDRTAWLSALVPLSTGRWAVGRSTTPTGVLGGLAMKKMVAVAIVMALALLAWRGLGHGWLGERSASRGRQYVVEEPLVTQPAQLAPALTPEVIAQRQPLAQAPPATTGALQLTFKRANGAPASDFPLAIDCANDPAPRVEAFRARTDAAGAVLVGELFAGPVRIWTDDRNRFDAEVEAGATRALEFTLSEGFDVTGTVVDADGAPVAGASIWCGRHSNQMPCGSPRALSASDGTFRLEDVDAFAPIGARAPGYVASECLQPMDMPGGPDGARILRLVLGPHGGRVRGRVLDPVGEPLAGARVLAGPDGGSTTPARGPGLTPEAAFAECDAQGDFELPNDLAPGTHPLDAVARAFPIWSGEVEVIAGQTTTVEIRLERPARIEGRLLGVDGAPVSGMKVLASAEDRGGWYHDRFAPSEGETDAEGRFTLDWVAPGTRELNAHDYRRPGLGRARASVVCAAGETATCELRLELGLTIAGRVVDEDGAPLAGWTVASESPLMQQWYPRQAKTDAHGAFLLANLGDSAHDLLVRSPDSGEHPRTQVEGVPVGTKDLVLVVADAHAAKGTVRGRLVAPAGAALESLTLLLWKEGTNEGHFLEADARTGVFEVQASAGEYRVTVKEGHKELLSSPLFELEAGGLTDLGELGIEAAGKVEIALTGFPETALERLKLSLDRAGCSTANPELSDGLWRSPELLPGVWTVSVNSGDLCLRPREIEVVAGTTTRVELAVELTVRVKLAFTNPARDEVTLEALDASGKQVFRRTYLPPRDAEKDSDERVLSLGLPAGHARIRVRTHAGLSGEVELDVQPSLASADPIEVKLR